MPVVVCGPDTDHDGQLEIAIISRHSNVSTRSNLSPRHRKTKTGSTENSLLVTKALRESRKKSTRKCYH